MVVSGKVSGDGQVIYGRYNKGAEGVIHKLEIKEHKTEWRNNANKWYDNF